MFQKRERQLSKMHYATLREKGEARGLCYVTFLLALHTGLAIVLYKAGGVQNLHLKLASKKTCNQNKLVRVTN